MRHEYERNIHFSPVRMTQASMRDSQNINIELDQSQINFYPPSTNALSASKSSSTSVQNSKLSLPLNLSKEAVICLETKNSFDPSTETLLKNTIRRAFSSNRNMQQVCQDVAQGASDSLKVSSQKTMQVCALVNLNAIQSQSKHS